MTEYKKSGVVMVFNDKGELLLQMRSPNDTSFPSHWDFSAGGGIDPGEDGKQTASRELMEELGIKANIEFVAEEHYEYQAWNSTHRRIVVSWIYKTQYNGSFKIDENEIEKVEFFSLEKIDEMIKSGVKFHPEFTASWKKGTISQAAEGYST